MRISLKTKLLSGFFLLIALPAIILGYMSYRQASHALQAAIEEQLSAEVRGAAKLVQAATDTMSKIVEISASRAVFQDAVSGMGGDRAWVGLRELQKSYEHAIEDVFIANQAGQILLTAQAGPGSDVSLKDREYFAAAIGGKGIISNVLISKFSGKPVVVVAYPLIKEGQVVGVLGVTIDFALLSKSVAELKAGGNRLWLYNRPNRAGCVSSQ